MGVDAQPISVEFSALKELLTMPHSDHFYDPVAFGLCETDYLPAWAKLTPDNTTTHNQRAL